MAVAKTRDIPHNKVIETIGGPSRAHTSDSSTIGICTEVYPDFGMAKIESHSIGTKILPYDITNTPLVGTSVVIDLASNLPRIGKRVYFGYTPSKTLIFNLDAIEDGTEFIYRQDKDPDWGEEGEQLSSLPLLIKHEEGEKVFNVDFGGLKIGYESVTLFYHPQSRLQIFRDNINIRTINSEIITMSGKLKFHCDVESEESGYVSSTAFKKDDDELFEYVREFKGNVSKAVSDAGITISKFPGDAGDAYSSALYCMMILDRDVSAYERDHDIVDHDYVNRELKITGGGDNPIHKKLLTKAKVDEESISSKAIICKIDEDEFAITYLKLIGQTGDIYEFNAGKKTSVSGEQSTVVIGDNNLSVFGDYNISIQDSYRTDHFPSSENTSSHYEFFGSTLRNIKGDSEEKYWRKGNFTYIDTRRIHEVDTDSDIDTMDYCESPKSQNLFQTRTSTFEDNKDLDDSTIGDRKILTKDDIEANMNISPTVSNSFNMTLRAKGIDTYMNMASSGISFLTKGQIDMRSKVLAVDSKTNNFSGRTLFGDGIIVEGLFYINADSIYLVAKDILYLKADNIYSEAEDSFVVSYKNTFQAYTTEIVVENNKTLMASGIFMQKTSTHIQGSSMGVYGEESIVAVAEKTAVFGANKTSIQGLQE